MFNFNSVADQVASAVKSPLTFVEDKAIRASLENLVDVQTRFTKTVYETNLELAKQVVEAATKADYTKSLEKFNFTK